MYFLSHSMRNSVTNRQYVWKSSIALMLLIKIGHQFVQIQRREDLANIADTRSVFFVHRLAIKPK